MAMKVWERTIIEYRPNITYRRAIRTRIIKEIEKEESGLTYKPTIVVDRLLQKTGSEVIDKLLSTLSKAHKRLQDLKKELADEDVYIEYEKARDENDKAQMLDILIENIKDINGHPSFNVYPMLDGFVDEMEGFLDFVNDILFDGSVDYDNPSITQKEEEEKLEEILQVESEDLVMPEKYPFTKEQIALIEQAMKDPDSDFKTLEEYEQAMKEEILKQGSPNINYAGVSDRVQIIEALDKKADMFDGAIDKIGNHLDTRLPDFVDGDIDGAFDYIMNTPNPPPNVHDLVYKNPTNTTGGISGSTSNNRFPGGTKPNNGTSNESDSDSNLVNPGLPPGTNPGTGGTGSGGSSDTDTDNGIDGSPGTGNTPGGDGNNDSTTGDSIVGNINTSDNVGDAGSSTIGTTLNPDDIHTGSGGTKIEVQRLSSLENLSEAVKIAHRYYANKSLNCVKNMMRVGDRELRDFMDEQLKIIALQKKELVDSLRMTMDVPGTNGSICVYEGVTEAVRAVNNAWKFILVEHISTTELNDDQSQRTFDLMDYKKAEQILYQYMSLLYMDVANGNALNQSSDLSSRDLMSPKFW